MNETSRILRVAATFKEEQTTRFVIEATPIAFSHAGTAEYEVPQSSIAW